MSGLLAFIILTAGILTGEKHAPLPSKQAQRVLSEIAEGDRYFAAFDDEKAYLHYEKAHELDPMNFDAHMKLLRTNNNIGQTLRDKNENLERAQIIFQRNVELAEDMYKRHPEKAESYFSLAIAYGNLALYASARDRVRLSKDIEKNLLRSIAIDPKFPYAYLGLGIFYREVARITVFERFFAKLFFSEVPSATLAQSEHYFEESLKRDPKFVFTRYHYGLALKYDHKLKAAKAEFQAAIDLPQSDSQDPMFKDYARKELKKLNEQMAEEAADPFNTAN